MDAAARGGWWKSGSRIGVKLASDFLGRLLHLALFVAAARILPPADFGRYALALSIGLVLAALADVGLQPALVRRLSTTADAVARSKALGSALVARTVVAVPLAAGGALVAASSAPTALDGLALAAIVVAQVAVATADLWLAVARVAGRLEIEAAILLGARIALACLGISVLAMGGGVVALSGVYLAVALGTVIITSAVSGRLLRPSRPRRIDEVVSSLGEALPLGVGLAASLVMFRIDVVILGWLRGPLDVATYSVAFRLFEASLLPPIAVMAAVFPELVRRSTDLAAFTRLAIRTGWLMAAIGLAGAVGGWLLGPAVVQLLFGEDYARSADLLPILVLAIPFLSVNTLLTFALIALGRSWSEAAAMVVTLVAVVLLDLAVIPTHGTVGAAWVTVCGEVVLATACAVGLIAARRSRAAVDEPTTKRR